MQPAGQKLRISQSSIEIDDILSDLQQIEPPFPAQGKKTPADSNPDHQKANQKNTLATKRAAHKETKEQNALKV